MRGAEPLNVLHSSSKDIFKDTCSRWHTEYYSIYCIKDTILVLCEALTNPKDGPRNRTAWACRIPLQALY